MVPTGVPIVDQDLAAYQYKKQGFSDYQDIASVVSSQRIREFLFNEEDFGLELNLGFPSHYSYLRSIATFNRENRIELILFFTDDINLCLDRAEIRYMSGGHEVKPDVIREMYAGTMSLLEQNKQIFHSVRLVDVTYDAITELTPDQVLLPQWVTVNKLDMHL